MLDRITYALIEHFTAVTYRTPIRLTAHLLSLITSLPSVRQRWKIFLKNLGASKKLTPYKFKCSGVQFYPFSTLIAVLIHANLIIVKILLVSPVTRTPWTNAHRSMSSFILLELLRVIFILTKTFDKRYLVNKTWSIDS